jgi:hypothetical protein
MESLAGVVIAGLSRNEDARERAYDPATHLFAKGIDHMSVFPTCVGSNHRINRHSTTSTMLPTAEDARVW